MLNVLLNILLFVLKYIGGKITRSVAVTSDAFNNLTDAFTTMLTWFGVKVSSIGEGTNHSNGHGRFEWIIGLLSSCSVIVVGWELLKESIIAIKNPENTVFSVFTFLVLVISIIVKFTMYLFNKKAAERKDSESLKALSVDSLSDAISTTVVLVCIIINRLTGLNLDGWCGIAVALFIMKNGFEVFGEITNRIMGKPVTEEETAGIKAFCMENSLFSDIVDIMFEDYGYGRRRILATAIGHMSDDPNTLLSEATNLKYRIFREYGYQAMISVERLIDEDDEIKNFIVDNLDDLSQECSVQSLRTSDAGCYKLVQLVLDTDLMNSEKTLELRKKINDRLDNAPTGYKILTRFRIRDKRKHRST